MTATSPAIDRPVTVFLWNLGFWGLLAADYNRMGQLVALAAAERQVLKQGYPVCSQQTPLFTRFLKFLHTWLTVVECFKMVNPIFLVHILSFLFET
ncbi:hypothetical protein [Streptococcus lactarius]|uniref:hypothetical protein n=1 Tax=Streptococcus lactarius TaxID=684066 RepID=UPI00360F53B8